MIKWPVEKLEDHISVLTDYHANGSYEVLKKNVELLDEPDYAVMIRTTNFEKEDFSGDLKYINQHAYDFLKKSRVYGGDILMNKIANAGSVYLMPELSRPVSLAMNLFLIRISSDQLDQSFAYYYLKTNELYIKSFATGSTTTTITKKAVRNLDIVLPPIDVQRKIVDTIQKYQTLIENNKRRIQLLEDSARQLYKEWFVRFRFPGHEHVKIIDGVPEGWINTTADQAMNILSGGTPKTSVPDYWDGEIGFFTPKDATDTVYVSTTEKTITALGLEKCASNLYPKNTLFITARGTVGNLNLAQKPMAMNQSCYALVGIEPISQFYLYFAMQAGIQQVKSRAVGAVFDAIIKDTFRAIPFLTPPNALIDEFTDYVQPILAQIDILMVSTERLVQARDLLLPKLMSGEIAV